MKVNKILYMIIVVCIASAAACTNKDDHKLTEGVFVDSCQIIVHKKIPSSKGLQELVVNISSSKSTSRDSIKFALLQMQDKFEWISDSVILAPVFCQPIATGVKGKYTYLVSFDVQTADTNQNKYLRVLPNAICNATVNYKL